MFVRESSMLTHWLERTMVRLCRLTVSASLGGWICLSPVSAQFLDGSNCRDDGDRVKIVEVQDRIAIYDGRVQGGQVLPPDVQAELDGLRKELAAILARCLDQMRDLQPVPDRRPLSVDRSRAAKPPLAGCGSTIVD